MNCAGCLWAKSCFYYGSTTTGWWFRAFLCLRSASIRPRVHSCSNEPLKAGSQIGLVPGRRGAVFVQLYITARTRAVLESSDQQWGGGNPPISNFALGELKQRWTDMTINWEI